MRVQSVVVKDGRCIEEAPAVVSVIDFPQQLQRTAAIQFIYTVLTNCSSVTFTLDQMNRIYQILCNMNIDNYIKPVFQDKNEDVRFLMSLEISNLFAINGISMTQDTIYNALFG